MKKYKIILFANFLTLSLFATGVFSQPTNVFKADAIVHVSDTVVFKLNDYVGEHVKWQLSHNLEDWADIPGATSDSLLFVADTTTYFRARVIAGFCDPFYSDIKKVQVDHQVEPGTVVDIDGNVYQTVIIGNQEWMAENLRVTRYNNEDDIPTGLSDAEWGNTTSGAYALYPHEGGGVSEDDVEGINSDEEMAASYGKLYNWYATTDARGLCPEGWNVPSDANWTQLINYLDGSNKGNMLKSCRQVDSPLDGDCNTVTHPRWNAHGTNYGIDAVGFGALPSGGRNHTHGFVLIGSFGFYWSSSSYSAANAWNRVMSNGSGSVNQVDNDKRMGFSVRCFRDIDN